MRLKWSDLEYIDRISIIKSIQIRSSQIFIDECAVDSYELELGSDDEYVCTRLTVYRVGVTDEDGDYAYDEVYSTLEEAVEDFNSLVETSMNMGF